MRRAAAWAFWLLSAAPLHAARTEQIPGPSIEDIRRKEAEAERVVSAMQRMEDRIRDCRQRLDAGLDLEKEIAECIRAAKELATDQEKLGGLTQDFHYLRSGLTWRTFGASALHHLSDAEWRAPDSGMIQELNDFPDRLKAAQNQADWEISALGDSLDMARNTLAARARRRRACSAGAALAALAAGLWFLRRGGRRKPESPASPTLSAIHGTDTQDRILNGNYRVDKEIGRGGMGVVYEADDLSLKRKVAIKRMHMEMEQAELGRLFLREAQVVAALQHPNIVAIYDMFEEQGRIYLVFEYVVGETALGPMPLSLTKNVLAQVCAALDYAHGRKVIHRDLKPSNIMIGTDGIVKVMDFGIARQTNHSVTRTQGWGTPPYMAPEQELGTVSKESDLYALGACLYELVTGTPPFVGPDFLGQKQRMQYSTAGLTAGLEAVVRKALDPDPAKRYHTGAEFAAAVLKI